MRQGQLSQPLSWQPRGCRPGGDEVLQLAVREADEQRKDGVAGVEVILRLGEDRATAITKRES